MCSQSASGAAARPRCLAAPGHAGVALAAQPLGPLGSRAARALATLVLGEFGDETGMVHESSFHSGDSSAFVAVNLR
jgi:hypothetical protein